MDQLIAWLLSSPESGSKVFFVNGVSILLMMMRGLVTFWMLWKRGLNPCTVGATIAVSIWILLDLNDFPPVPAEMADKFQATSWGSILRSAALVVWLGFVIEYMISQSAKNQALTELREEDSNACT